MSKKERYRIRNWPQYNKSLVKRGSLTLWFDEESIKKWHKTKKAKGRGRPCRNIPASFKTILCNFLSHGLRKFDDLKESYPEPCLHIIKQIADVYEHDEKTKGIGQGSKT